MLFDGKREMLANLYRKKELMRRGDPRHTQFVTGLAVQGGAFCGVNCAGQMAALDFFGLTDVFDLCVTASTGTTATPFFLTGQVNEARSVYWNECQTEEFLSKSLHKLARGEPVMNIDYLVDDVLKEMLDIDALRRSRTAIYATATKKDGSGALFELRTCAQPFEAMKASIAIPGLSRGSVIIDGEEHFDGEGAYPFPATELIARGATDILVLANCPKPKEGVELASAFPPFLLRSLTPEAQKTFENQHVGFASGLAELRKCRSYGILWTDGAVTGFDRDPELLETTSYRAEDHFKSILSQVASELHAELAA